MTRVKDSSQLKSTGNPTRELSAERHDDGHDEVGECGEGGPLCQVHLEDVLEVLGLRDEEEVEGPRPGKVGHNDGPHGHACEDLEIKHMFIQGDSGGRIPWLG